MKDTSVELFARFVAPHHTFNGGSENLGSKLRNGAVSSERDTVRAWSRVISVVYGVDDKVKIDVLGLDTYLFSVNSEEITRVVNSFTRPLPTPTSMRDVRHNVRIISDSVCKRIVEVGNAFSSGGKSFGYGLNFGEGGKAAVVVGFSSELGINFVNKKLVIILQVEEVGNVRELGVDISIVVVNGSDQSDSIPDLTILRFVVVVVFEQMGGFSGCIGEVIKVISPVTSVNGAIPDFFNFSPIVGVIYCVSIKIVGFSGVGDRFKTYGKRKVISDMRTSFSNSDEITDNLWVNVVDIVFTVIPHTAPVAGFLKFVVLGDSVWSRGDDFGAGIIESNTSEVEVVKSKINPRGDEAIVVFFVKGVAVLVYFLEVVGVDKAIEGLDSGRSLVFMVAAAIYIVLSVIEVAEDNGVVSVLVLI